MAYALITGASGGIGWTIAQSLAARRHDILLVARTADKLKANAAELSARYGIKTDFLAIDLALPEAPQQVFNWVQEKGYAVDILINNAGYGLWGKVENSSASELQDMMRLNMLTLTELCRIFIPALKQQSKAYILNVASTAAYQAVPTLTTYAATKAFVLLFSRGLRLELQGTPVSVSCLCPGSTTTGFIDRARMTAMRAKAEKVSMTPEDVAEIGVRGLLAGKPEIIPGALNYISAKLAEIAPKFLPETIAHNLYKG